MPRKNKNSYNKYMRDYMMNMRREQKRALQKLKNQHPDIYRNLFAKPKFTKKPVKPKLPRKPHRRRKRK